jgi:DNA-binding NtrC family response regulator
MKNKNKRNLLLIDDSYSVLKQLLSLLDFDLDNYSIHSTLSVEEAIPQLATLKPDLIIVSIEPKSMKGLEIINWVKKERLPIAVIAASTDASPEMTASTIRAGATDFLQLPCSPERMGQSIAQAITSLKEESDNNHLDHPIFDESVLGFIGAGKSMLEVSKLIISAAKSDASVFITGENGTGKDVCAQLIHKLSHRNEHTMVPLNCAAIPKDLAESEVFGHVKGSFTGAHEDRSGVARLADKGTLFLDEIGEMSIDLQTKLLRFIQTSTFNRVGSGLLEEVDVRFVCATNRDPQTQIETGSFREDLFYRLNVIQIHLPPLRNRGDDILVFAKNFLTQFSEEEGKNLKDFSLETENLLKAYRWPGNVRELQNVIRSVVVLHDGCTVIPSMLPLAIIREKGERRRGSDQTGSRNRAEVELNNPISTLPEGQVRLEEAGNLPHQIKTLDEVINETIDSAISHCNGNVVEASYHLGVSPSTLYRRIKTKKSDLV